jgi:hypothetical protein
LVSGSRTAQTAFDAVDTSASAALRSMMPAMRVPAFGSVFAIPHGLVDTSCAAI